MRAARAVAPSLLAACGALTACGGTPAGPPDVLLLTLDTTRADRLGCYGHAAARTPRLDRLAREGVRFTDASATAPTTLPSHASILTGLFPPTHGARNNGNHRLAAEVDTLAERLRAAGYATGAFVAAEVLAARYGLDQGFERYDDDFLRDASAFGDGYRERSADTIVDRALAWLAEQDDGPRFAWLHFFDPHFPYVPAADAPELAPYDAELARVDRAVARLLDAIGTANTLVAVVADHGEGLGDHGEDTHGLFVYQATIRVPLILHGPGVPAGRVVDAPVSTVDLAPTLLALAGAGGLPRAQGRSLAPLWNDGDDGPRPIYFETLLPRYEYLWSNLAGMREGTDKLISAPTDELYDLAQDPGEATNRLPQLPEAEREAWRARFAELVAGFPPPPAGAGLSVDAGTERGLAALGYGFAPIRVDDAHTPLPDPKDRLADHHRYRAIQDAARREDWAGVLERTRGARVADDPYAALFAARAHQHLGDHGRAEALYRALLGRFPDDPVCLRGLASVLFDAQRLGEARASYARLVELDPLHPQHHAGLGDCLVRLGDPDGARAAWEAALAADPYFVKALNNLGILAAQAGRHDEARARFERILALEPDHVEARANLQRLAREAR